MLASGFSFLTERPSPGSAKSYLRLENIHEAVDGTPVVAGGGRLLDGWSEYGPLAGSFCCWNSGAIEKSSVLDDRATDPEAFLRLRESARRGSNRRSRSIFSLRVAYVAGAVEFVRAALRHGVDQEAGEVALANVVRRQEDLVFLDCLERDLLGARLSARLQRRAQAEQVVRDGAVDLNGVEAVVLATAGVARALRRDLRDELRRSR